jgi:hypothetical protein
MRNIQIVVSDIAAMALWHDVAETGTRPLAFKPSGSITLTVASRGMKRCFESDRLLEECIEWEAIFR